MMCLKRAKVSPESSPAALVRSQHFSGVADEFAEKTRSTGMTLTIGLARSIGLAIVRLGVAASLRALLVACRAGRASESIARSSRCTWPEMARDGARWREMAEARMVGRGHGAGMRRRGTRMVRACTCPEMEK